MVKKEDSRTNTFSATDGLIVIEKLYNSFHC